MFMEGVPCVTLNLTAVAEDALKLASPEYLAWAVCIPTASAGGVQMAIPPAFSGTVALTESIVNAAVPVATPLGLPATELAPIGRILRVRGEGESYATLPPGAMVPPAFRESVILQFSGVTLSATGADVLLPNTPSPPYLAETL
jgi:hypothetical protein